VDVIDKVGVRQEVAAIDQAKAVGRAEFLGSDIRDIRGTSGAGWPWAVTRPGLPQIRTWAH
jgi:hypothetical protein